MWSRVPHVLVVEDDPAMGALVQRGLVDQGYEVTLVDNGVDALVAFANEKLDVAVIDVMLPRMNGFEVCRHIRESGSMLPLLLITARDALDDRIFGLDSGADDYVTKPFHFGELSARIRAQVRRQSGSPKPVVQIGDVHLDAPDRACNGSGTSLCAEPQGIHAPALPRGACRGGELPPGDPRRGVGISGRTSIQPSSTNTSAT